MRLKGGVNIVDKTTDLLLFIVWGSNLHTTASRM